MLKMISIKSSRREMVQRDSVELLRGHGVSGPHLHPPMPSAGIPSRSPQPAGDSHRHGWDGRDTRGRPGRGQRWQRQGASSTRPRLPSISPMETASPSRQDRQPRRLLLLRAKPTHFCRRGEKRQRGEPGHKSLPVQAPSSGTWWPCILRDGYSPVGAGRGAGGLGELMRAAWARSRDSMRAAVLQEMVCKEARSGQRCTAAACPRDIGSPFPGDMVPESSSGQFSMGGQSFISPSSIPDPV